jgi:hypothetical protein
VAALDLEPLRRPPLAELEGRLKRGEPRLRLRVTEGRVQAGERRVTQELDRLTASRADVSAPGYAFSDQCVCAASGFSTTSCPDAMPASTAASELKVLADAAPGYFGPGPTRTSMKCAL